ncbi:MAG TPA: ABC transporter ATP-binding protein [Gammaproteobacteria bacterium]|nr:ABC transporter ATP-binding protein [Gammaproteobacteria bacterium]
MSVDDVEREAAELRESGPEPAELDRLAGDDIVLTMDDLSAGYGRMQILHRLQLRLGRGQSLCLIGPNGAGKSTVLHTAFGFTRVFGGTVTADGRDITALPTSARLRDGGLAYVLQDNSVFPDMTVEENLLMGGYLSDDRAQVKQAVAHVLEKYPRLRERAHNRAAVLSGGERRLLEISRALIMNPAVLLVDEPSIGLEPRFIDMVFEILADLQETEGKTILMVEQNARKGLEFADIGYVLVSGQLARAGPGSALLDDEEVGRLFLGG